ncbi:DNA polymerase III subunit alpha [Helicobacter sp. 23-1045]
MSNFSGNFTHLHLHTEYSLLDGANQIKKLAKQLKSFGMDSVAITDHGVLHGAIDFYTTMLKEGIKPIIGIETYIHNGESLDTKDPQSPAFHLCLFAKNEVGYKNLMYLSSMACLKGFYRKPRINKAILRQRCEGLICSSACLQGEVNYHLNTIGRKNTGAKGYDYAKQVALEYKDIFGDDFYIEIMRHGIAEQKFIDEQVIKLSRECDIKLIATNDAHYTQKEHAFSQEILMCISTGKKLQDSNRLKHSVNEFYVKSQAEMRKIFADIPEVLENTQEIADKCNLIIDLKSIELKNDKGEVIIPYSAPTPPSFKFTSEYAKNDGLDFSDDEPYFRYKCLKGLESRLKTIDESMHETYKKRLEYEMQVIATMKFCGYMLIVWDFVREAKARKIPVGPGRGSAAGSLVAFCLEITDIDPLKHDLLFERFLNPERVSMPDIDMDFCQSRRGEIIEYVEQKYGKYNVAHVVTFNSMSAKSVIRDVARVFDVEYKKADEFAKLIPNELKIHLNDAFEKEPKIANAINGDEVLRKVWDMSLNLESQKRNTSTHAAAIVIDSENELWDKIPLCLINNEVVTQYSMDYLEKVNLIKFDFLGLKTLTVIQNALEIIPQKIDFNNVNLNDKKVYDEIQAGNTLGMFQIESNGMRSAARILRPSTFEDILAMIALYRPGPMGTIDEFSARKHGTQKIEYIFDELKPILEKTYGAIIYQEQIMQIVQVIGGFSLGEADLIRRAMGKKDAKIMQDNKEKFLNGAESKGFARQKCESLWELIVKFAEYGFNKSHSAAYAFVTFQTAYLKTYYRYEFMAALLTSEKNKPDNINKYIEECRNMGIEVLPPHINYSNKDFSVVEIDGTKKIIYGFSAIKGIGEKPIENILEARAKNGGKFNNLEEFLSKMDSKVINKRVLESLAKSGSLGNLGYNTRTIIENLDLLADKVRENSSYDTSNALFVEETPSISLDIKAVDEFSKAELLDFEYDMIGIFMSGNPMEDYKDKIKKIKGVVLGYQIQDLQDRSRAFIVGVIKDIKFRISKKGTRFAEVLIVDSVGNVQISVFEKDLPVIENAAQGVPLCFLCQAGEDSRDKSISLRLSGVLSFEEAQKRKIIPEFKKDAESSAESNAQNAESSVDSANLADSAINANALNDSCLNFTFALPCDISYAKLKEIQNLALNNVGDEVLIFMVKDGAHTHKITTALKINDNFKSKVKEIA